MFLLQVETIKYHIKSFAIKKWSLFVLIEVKLSHSIFKKHNVISIEKGVYNYEVSCYIC